MTPTTNVPAPANTTQALELASFAQYDYSDYEVLEELDNIITDLEKQVTEKDTTISELNNEITTIKTDLEKYSNDYKTLEDWLNKISEHPILWPLAIKLVQWEEVNIPDYLMKAVESDLEAIPKLDWIETQSTPERELRPKNKILAWVNLSYK